MPADFLKKKHSLRFLHAWLGLTLSEQGNSKSKLPSEPTWGGGHLLRELPAPPRVLPYRKEFIQKWHVWRIDECSHSPFCFQKNKFKSKVCTKLTKIDGASLATWQAQDWNSNKILGFWKLWCIVIWYTSATNKPDQIGWVPTSPHTIYYYYYFSLGVCH